ncbi:unnamed protein product [Heterobilharzia americana]|nr:unnamed protein product [Heterobilharzia americana]
MHLSDILGFFGIKELLFSCVTFLLSMVTDVFKEKENSRQKISKQCALDELRAIREGGLRENERVVDLWKLSLSDCINKLGYEKYSILEQVFIAALDVGDEDLACECLDRLLAKFRNSSRINRLFGMYLESKGNFEDAQNIYAKLIKDDPTNTLARKRMIAILKSQQRIPEAINELREYLKIFMSDFEAWNELADLYLSECDYKHAAFCMEEMILSNPSNHLYCQRYAEIKYTEGGTENLELARTYYTQACLLCPNNLRSLYGLLLTCSALDNHLPKSIELFSLTSDSKLQNEPCTVNAYGNIVDGNPTVNNNNCLHQNNHSRLNTNHQLLMKQQQTSGFSTLSTSLSNSEKNKQLAKWAAAQIRLIYMVCDSMKCIDNQFANLNSVIPSSSITRVQSPKGVDQYLPKKYIRRNLTTTANGNNYNAISHVSDNQDDDANSTEEDADSDSSDVDSFDVNIDSGSTDDTDCNQKDCDKKKIK